jgi:hypothetical protein
MWSSSVDPEAIRVGLERQLALLTLVVEHLQTAAADASPLVSDDWRGDLRDGLRAAADEADDLARTLRVTIATLS